MIPLIWGIAALVGFALALAFGRTWRRTGALVLLGLVLAVAWLRGLLHGHAQQSAS